MFQLFEKFKHEQVCCELVAMLNFKDPSLILDFFVTLHEKKYSKTLTIVIIERGICVLKIILKFQKKQQKKNFHKFS